MAYAKVKGLLHLWKVGMAKILLHTLSCFSLMAMHLFYDDKFSSGLFSEATTGVTFLSLTSSVFSPIFPVVCSHSLAQDSLFDEVKQLSLVI